MATLDDHAARLAAAADALLELEPRLLAGGPWPLAERFGIEPEASWGPPEVLAHVSEMIPYWLGELERVLAQPATADPVPFGRVSNDQVRVAIIGRDRTIPIGELLARIASEARRAATRLREIEAAGAAGRTGLHPRLGPIRLDDGAERFLASHAEEHVRQLRDVLDAAG
jgi:hypothetical protein